MLDRWVGLATMILSVIVLWMINKVRGIEKQFATILDDYIVENNEIHKRLDLFNEKMEGKSDTSSFSNASFNGFKEGYVYKTSGPQGAGYYKISADKKPESNSRQDNPPQQSAPTDGLPQPQPEEALPQDVEQTEERSEEPVTEALPQAEQQLEPETKPEELVTKPRKPRKRPTRKVTTSD